MDTDIKIFRMSRLGIPYERIAEKLGLVRTSFHYHLSRGLTVAQVAQKDGWPEPMALSHALKN